MFRKLYLSWRAADTDPNTVEIPSVENSTIGDQGWKVLKQPDPGPPSVEVIFVHGLAGNRQSTWTRKLQASEVFWPADLLPEKVPNARISTWGYDAHFQTLLRMPNQNRIANHAKNLLTDIANFRAETNTTGVPIIFITHSLGGLVVKRALIASDSSPDRDRKNIVEATYAIGFLGTPHYGASKAYWLALANSLTAVLKSVNKNIVTVLEPDSEVLAEIENDFKTLVRRRAQNGKEEIKCTCFYEEQEVPGIGIIVPKHSATLGGYESVGIPANHTDMPKFGSARDVGFVRVSGEIRRWTAEIESKARSDSLTEQQSVLLTSLCRSSGQYQVPDSEAHPNTFQWICHANVTGFPEWLTDGDDVFWIQGKPGSGKSTLMKYLSSHLNLLFGSTGTIIVAKFFFDSQGQPNEQTFEALLRNLLVQLLRQIEAKSWVHLVDVPNSFSPDDEFRGDRSKWNLHDLRGLFDMLMNRNLKVKISIFIDALDECTGNLRQIIAYFRSISRSAKMDGLSVKVVISSQPLPVLVAGLGDCTNLVLEDHNTEDISRVVTDKMAQLQSSEKDAESLSNLKEKIIGLADGIFLWVVLMIEDLLEGVEDGDTEEELKDKLSSIPGKGDLNDMYSRLIGKIKREHIEDAWAIFRIVACATRPLSLLELRHVLVFGRRDAPGSLGHLESHSAFIQNEENLAKRLRSRCGGLVQITTAGFVRFIHPTVYTFLDRDAIQHFGFCNPENNILKGHQFLFTACAKYLNVEELVELPVGLRHGDRFDVAADLSTILNEMPFLHYTTMNWMRHWKHSEVIPSSHSDINELLGTLSESNFRSWIRLYNISNRQFTDHFHHSSLLYFAVENNIMTYVSRELQRNNVVNQKDGRFGFYLHAAAAQDLPEMAQLLLDAGAFVNNQTRAGETALHVASTFGSLNAAMVLVGHEPELNLRDVGGETALLRAMRRNQKQMTELLLQHGADPNITDLAGWGPLNQMVLDVEILRITLNHRISLSSIPHDLRKFRRSHHRSDSNHYLQILQMLRQHEYVMSRTDLNESLRYACEKCDTELVNYLSECGAELSDIDALHIAQMYKDPVFVIFVADRLGYSFVHGLNHDVDGRSPLCMAASYGNSETFKFLIEKGAHVNPESPLLKTTPLHNAIKANNIAAAEFLIGCGALVDVLDENMKTPLLIALDFVDKSVSLNMVKLLLNNGANPGRINQTRDIDSMITQGDWGAYPIHRAAETRSRDIIQELVVRGADASVLDSHGNTVFHRAAIFRFHGARSEDNSPYVEALQYLWEVCIGPDGAISGDTQSRRRAHLNKQNALGKSAAHEAAFRWPDSEILLRFLIEQGIDTDIQDKTGKTVLHQAVVTVNSIDVVEIILQRTTNVNIQDLCGRTPIFCAILNVIKKSRLFYEGEAEKSSQFPTKSRQQEATIEPELSLISILLRNGADYTIPDNTNTSPLEAVVSEGEGCCREILTLCIGPSTSPAAGSAEILCRLFTNAIKAENYEAAETLLGYGIDISAIVDNAIHLTLHLAIPPKMVVDNHYLPPGAVGDQMLPEEPVKRFRTSIRARLDHCEKMAQLLVNHGADLNKADEDGKSALQNAVNFGLARVCLLFLKAGAKPPPSSSVDSGATPYEVWADSELIQLVQSWNGDNEDPADWSRVQQKITAKWIQPVRRHALVNVMDFSTEV